MVFLFSEAIGKLPSKTMGNVLSTTIGKVLAIYNISRLSFLTAARRGLSMKKVVREGGEMILSDWLSIVPPIVALVLLYLDKKIPRRFGDHIVGPIKFKDHFPRFTKDGNPLPGKWHVCQARINSLRRFLLWTVAVVGIVIFILRKLRW